jgi:polyhydroxyalkanoate synthase
MNQPAEKRSPAASPNLAEDAAKNTVTLNPLVGIRTEDLVDAAKTVVKAFATQPAVVTEQWLSFMGEMGKVLTGQSQVSPDPKDKRFADPAWKSSVVHRTLMQSYIAWANSVNSFVDRAKLPDKDAARAKLVTQIFIDAMAPSNLVLGNPTALREMVDSGGKSLLNGLKNFTNDLLKNGGLPSQVDMAAFKVGGNLANTPGAVVFKNDVIELVQYAPVVDEIFRRPVLIVPPQINKYYAVDLSPDKSMIQFLLKNGFQPFCISWRNPTDKQREWGLDTYITAVDAAVDAALEITGAEDLTMMGSCSGGITAATYLGWLAGTGQKKVKNIISAVCVLDTESSNDTQFAALVTPETILAAKQVSATKGVLDGQELARMFAWMRPNDLIWNYWVNNYLMGKQPPAFDILYWNADTTRLPARLHHDYLDLIFTNPFVNANKLSIHGVPIDMGKVDLDSYVIAGTTDHITPWKACYQTARILNDNTTFILSNSGHLQSLLNPPGNPKAWFVTAPASETDADKWLTTAKRVEGSWWLHWRDWLSERSGEKLAKPASLGSGRNPPLAAAPGTYVFE